MNPPVRKRLKPHERRTTLLNAAADVLLEDGIGALTLRHLAKRLGVAAGLVNHYFPEIEALAAEAFAMIAQGEVAVLFAAACAETAPAAQISRLRAPPLPRLRADRQKTPQHPCFSHRQP